MIRIGSTPLKPPVRFCYLYFSLANAAEFLSSLGSPRKAHLIRDILWTGGSV
jgi:hypothetical protein